MPLNKETKPKKNLSWQIFFPGEKYFLLKHSPEFDKYVYQMW